MTMMRAPSKAVLATEKDDAGEEADSSGNGHRNGSADAAAPAPSDAAPAA